uniref:Dolichyl-diphosphooligosaccharide--protein glycosyltransferase subunit DAD1 n=1 Tax=Salix viminalis TaxID=40686 RepID=A0A6N2KBY9_SALVM
MARTTSSDAQALFHSLRSAYTSTPTSLKIIDLYVCFAVFTAIIQVVYMAVVGSFPFNSFLSGVLSACRDCSPCCLSPYPSEQGKQGIQGFSTRACVC